MVYNVHIDWITSKIFVASIHNWCYENVRASPDDILQIVNVWLDGVSVSLIRMEITIIVF